MIENYELPSLCAFAECPDTIPEDASAVLRVSTLIRWLSLSRIDVEEIWMLAGIPYPVISRLMIFMYSDPLSFDFFWTASTFESFHADLLEMVTASVQIYRLSESENGRACTEEEIAECLAQAACNGGQTCQ